MTSHSGRNLICEIEQKRKMKREWRAGGKCRPPTDPTFILTTHLSQSLHLTSCKAFAPEAATLASTISCCKVCLSLFAFLFLSSCFALTFAKRRASQANERVKRQRKGIPCGSAPRAHLYLCYTFPTVVPGPHTLSPRRHAA